MHLGRVSRQIDDVLAPQPTGAPIAPGEVKGIASYLSRVRLPRRDLSRSQGYDAVGVAELVDPLAFLSKVMTPVGVPVAVGA